MASPDLITRLESLPDELISNVIRNVVTVDHAIDIGKMKQRDWKSKNYPVRWDCLEEAHELLKPFKESPRLVNIATEEYIQTNTFCVSPKDILVNRLGRGSGLKVFCSWEQAEDDFDRAIFGNKGAPLMMTAPMVNGQVHAHIDTIFKPLSEVTRCVRHFEAKIDMPAMNQDLELFLRLLVPALPQARTINIHARLTGPEHSYTSYEGGNAGFWALAARRPELVKQENAGQALMLIETVQALVWPKLERKTVTFTRTEGTRRVNVVWGAGVRSQSDYAAQARVLYGMVAASKAVVYLRC
ncbi:hypothetical protein LTR37_009247 [Vermiconidia calcicola]|uniref:Uncharacterized protein n=1 Tax=Vermiconidia calcicola TaxID=1690605 RepID=A0ACC3N9S5_9PEZI|nr:hypothetical protein LTR37_009247 [Vermiconidia calcicola]